jgi:hypothetical protein
MGSRLGLHTFAKSLVDKRNSHQPHHANNHPSPWPRERKCAAGARPCRRLPASGRRGRGRRAGARFRSATCAGTSARRTGTRECQRAVGPALLEDALREVVSMKLENKKQKEGRRTMRARNRELYGNANLPPPAPW